MHTPIRVKHIASMNESLGGSMQQVRMSHTSECKDEQNQAKQSKEQSDPNSGQGSGQNQPDQEKEAGQRLMDTTEDRIGMVEKDGAGSKAE